MSRNCGDCAAKPGEMHDPGCDVERCPLCGGQSISCGCVYKANGINRDTLEFTHPEVYGGGPTEAMYLTYDTVVEAHGGRLPWTGEWPGQAECKEFDLWCRWVNRATGEPMDFNLKVPGKWQPCDKDAPGAGADLNRLHEVAYWCKNRRRWVKKNEAS